MPAWRSFEQGCRRQLLFWHRRAGKDEINLNMHAVSSVQRPGTYWHMLPQAAQARKAIWNAVNPHSGKRRILEAFPAELIENMNDNEMFIRFKTNSTFQVVGSDNYNSLVGTPPVGITFSEWALANPTAWAYLSPILAENGGWASFITTPRGNNHAKKMYDAVKDDKRWFTQVLSADMTGAISKESIEEQRVTYRALFGDEIADMLIEQEFYCSFAGALIGSYFGTAMAAAEREGRICTVPIDPLHDVHTAWDLGKAANNPIWCFQVIGGKPRIVDFYRPDSDDLEEWVKWLDERGYKGNDYVPHDILVTEWGTKRTRFDTLKQLGRRPVRVAKVSVAEGIHAARQTIKVAVFDQLRCELGIEGLKQFRREWDEELKVFRDNPVKDWSEHIASSFRYLGLAWKEAASAEEPPKKPKELAYTVGPTGLVQGNMSVKDAVEAMVRRRRERD
nr:MAG TPA: large terminase [Caudoviricetes sp.]